MKNNVLEFKDVHLAEASGNEIHLQGICLTLAEGDLALMEMPAEYTLDSLADLACGLVNPEQGSVLFEGMSWPARSPDEAALARGRIGRVFEGPGWVSNLDVDENITLTARYHQHLPDDQAYIQARALAKRLGLSDLPPGRPSHIARAELRRAEWVRALLGPRVLVLLQQPMRDLPRVWGVALLAEIERQRAAGVAFIWIQPWGELPAEQLKPTLHFQVESGNILRT